MANCDLNCCATSDTRFSCAWSSTSISSRKRSCRVGRVFRRCSCATARHRGRIKINRASQRRCSDGHRERSRQSQQGRQHRQQKHRSERTPDVEHDFSHERFQPQAVRVAVCHHLNPDIMVTQRTLDAAHHVEPSGTDLLLPCVRQRYLRSDRRNGLDLPAIHVRNCLRLSVHDAKAISRGIFSAVGLQRRLADRRDDPVLQRRSVQQAVGFDQDEMTGEISLIRKVFVQAPPQLYGNARNSGEQHPFSSNEADAFPPIVGCTTRHIVSLFVTSRTGRSSLTSRRRFAAHHGETSRTKASVLRHPVGARSAAAQDNRTVLGLSGQRTRRLALSAARSDLPVPGSS